MNGAAAQQHAVILVHGTRFFGLNPTWTRPGSFLRRHLEDQFGDSLHLTTVEWSGRNTHGARSDAAAQLRKQLDENLKSYPAAQHTVICHSHGGNAALYALRDVPNAAKVNVVTLATPFLIARRRDFGPEGLVYFSSGALIPCWVAMWLVERTAWHESLPSVAQAITSMGAIALVVAVLGALAWFWYSRTERLVDDMKLATPRRDRLLIVRAAGDEASGALSGFQFIVQLCTRIFSWMTAGHRWVALWIRRLSKCKALAIVAIAFAGCVAALVGGMAVTHPLVQIPLLVGAGVLMVIVVMVAPKLLGFGDANSYVLALVAGALLWPIVLVLSLLLLPFGWRIAVANVLLDVTVEATPLGNWETHLFAPPTIEASGGIAAPISHSGVYETPAVLDLICGFIRGKS